MRMYVTSFLPLYSHREIKDRTVLKVYEKDGPEKSPRRHAAESRHLYNSGHESDSSTASSHRGAPRSPVHPKTNYPLSPRSPSHANYANVPVSFGLKIIIAYTERGFHKSIPKPVRGSKPTNLGISYYTVYGPQH